MKTFRFLIAIVISTLILTSLSKKQSYAQDVVAKPITIDELKQDRLWTQLWNLFGVKITSQVNQCSEPSYQDMTAAQFEIDTSTLTEWLRISSNFPTRFSFTDFHKRYPFVSKEAHLNRWKDFERLGFMNSVGPEQFLISRKGLAALDFYRLKREERFKECLSPSNSTLEFINKVFIDVIEAALKSSPNHCIYQRNLATPFKSDELISQVIENFSLLVAFRNDNAVGRHDWVSTLEANEWNGIELTAVQREIMEMLLTRDTVLLTRITENPFWRLDEQSSYAAIHELEKFGFVKAETETVIVTPVGRKYIEQASELADDAFYKPWLTLTPTQYNDFKATISSWAGQIP